MDKNDNTIIGLGFDKVYESSKEFIKDLLNRCPNAAVVNLDLCTIVPDQKDNSED